MSARWSDDNNYPWRPRGFLTPQPPAWKKTPSPVLPMSERKRTSPAGKGDCFHVIHKVPASSDSPYGRAKHVQLIDKDPSQAISLFWAAINAGDRVDSALKDMALVMKQLNRSDEAIEAIKSFRHLCPSDSQEPLDNILIELYKRSGRIEEEIEMLQNKLRNIDEGVVFGGKTTKIARSQGKKIQITIEQEKSRILGNLAWAYLQQHNYGIAEQHYRKALSLEPDRNKQCNLAICLMHMNRFEEAKSLLQDVKTSSGNEKMDEAYSKSYERALEMLIHVESTSKLKEASIFLPRNEDNISRTVDRRKLPYAQWEGKNDNFSGFDDRSSNRTPFALKANFQSSPQTANTEKWTKGSYLDSPSEAIFTQPRQCSWGFNNADQRRGGGRWGEDKVRSSTRKLSFDQALTSERVPLHSIPKLNEESQAFSNGNTQVEEQRVLFTQPRKQPSLGDNKDQRRGRWAEEYGGSSFSQLSFKNTTTSVNSHSEQNLYEYPLVSSKDAPDIIKLEEPACEPNKKSWADLVEEEEEKEVLTGKANVGKGEEEFNDENLNSNIMTNQHPDTNISKQLESLEITGGHSAAARRNRLQVFRDITSPRP